MLNTKLRKRQNSFSKRQFKLLSPRFKNNMLINYNFRKFADKNTRVKVRIQINIFPLKKW